jgi:hypothetical protein
VNWVLPAGLSPAEGLPPENSEHRAALVVAAGDCLREASAALRSVAVADRIAILVTWARAWADPRDPYRAEALSLLPQATGLSDAMVERALDLAFESVESERLRAWWEREAQGESSARLSAHISSSNVFTAGLPPVLASLLAGVPAFLRPPSTQPEFAALLARSWNERGLLGGEFLASATWDREERDVTRALLAVADRLYVFGDDDTVADFGRLAQDSRAGVRLLGFGHRISIAAIGREALGGIDSGPDSLATLDPTLPDSTLEALARDALAWDGGGCLTPRWIFVEGDAALAAAVARRAAPLVARVAEELPAGAPLDASAGAARAAYLGLAGFEGFATQGPGWAVASLAETRLQPDPPSRALIFVPLPDLAALPTVLASLGDHLQGLLYIGDDARRETLASALAGQGLSLAVSAGMLQRPPIDWNHDGVRHLHSLF